VPVAPASTCKSSGIPDVWCCDTDVNQCKFTYSSSSCKDPVHSNLYDCTNNPQFTHMTNPNPSKCVQLRVGEFCCSDDNI
jgi:hypothetical protein